MFPGSVLSSSVLFSAECELYHPLDLYRSDLYVFRTGYMEVIVRALDLASLLTRQSHSGMCPGLLLFPALQREGRPLD